MTQGSADPPEHLRERNVPHEMRRGNYNEDAFVVHDDHEAVQGGAKDGAREPAPGEANPLAEREGRGGDQRTSSLE